MIPIQQPSKTSCGLVVIALLTGEPVEDVLARLPIVRLAARVKKRSHGTNYGELCRLLKPARLTLERRMKGTPPLSGRFVLRVHRSHSNNWHWLLCVDGVVFNSTDASATSLTDMLRTIEPKFVSHYEVISL